MEFSKITWKTMALAVGIVVAILYSSFYLFNHELYNSPDETSQAYFIERVASGKNVAASVNETIRAHPYITPRSMRITGDGMLVPASFLGLIVLYGSFASLTNVLVLFVVMGIIGVLGIVAFYNCVRIVWGERIARISFFLALFFPGWWYYATLGLFSHVLVVTLILWSLYSYLLYKKTPKFYFSALSGFLVALALFVRLAIAPWFGGIWIVLLFLDIYTRRKRMFLFYSVWAIMIGLFFVLPSLLVHQSLFGAVLQTGYVLSQEGQRSLFVEIFFPGGIHPATAFKNFYEYAIILFWYVTIPSLLGMLYFFIHLGKARLVERKYLFISVAVSLWLIIYYGSWTLTDNINFNVSIGVAYVRYWLPLFLLLIPFAVYGYTKINTLIKSHNISLVVGGSALLLYVILSAYAVFYQFEDSLVPIKKTLAINVQIRDEVIETTEEDAVIVSSRHDKVFFPSRDVVHVDSLANMSEDVSALIEKRPVYVYTIDSNEFIVNEYGFLFNERSLELTEVTQLEKGALYALTNK